MSTTKAIVVNVTPIENKLFLLRQRAEAVQVVDQDSYREACNIKNAIRTEIKAIGFALDPGILSAKAHLDELKSQKAVHVDRWTPIATQVEVRAESWVTEEKRKAAAEQERINQERHVVAQRKADEERRENERIAKEQREAREKELEQARKAGEINKREQDKLKKQALADEQAARELAAQQAAETAENVQEVTVASSIPKVSGIIRRTNYKFEVVSASHVERAFMKPDEVAIGTKVRADKDPDKSMKEIGGIRVWTEDSI